MKILHLDDHLLFSEGLAALLSQKGSHFQLDVASSTQQALQMLDGDVAYDVLLVDLGMPELDGFAFMQSIEERDIFVPAVVLSATEDIWQVKRALDMGASGFIPKTYSCEAIVEVLDQVLAGDIYVPESLQGALAALPDNEPATERQKVLAAYQLTERQMEVLSLMQQGYNNDELASILNVSRNTIKTHVRTLFTAFQVNSRLACVRYAERIGLL